MRSHRSFVAATLATAGVLALVTTACSGTATTTTAAPSTSAASAGSSATSAVSSSTAAPGSTSSTSSTSSTASSGGGAATDTAAGLQQASWGDNVTVTFADGYLVFTSDGLPNHERSAEYAVPAGAAGAGAGGGVPTEATSEALADPSRAQTYSFKIPTTPTKAATPTAAGGGTIGVMISGAALFNPYEADGTTVALMSNFTVKNANGEDVAFLDTCNGHPNPMGAYHYHGLPPCVTATVDTAGGPSHIIGVAFDGYPIYGDRDIDGNQITAAQLDECNGITSPTPEFPEGVYHYVLLNTPDATSSIRCFTGTVDASLVRTRAMGGGMPGMAH